MVMTFANSFIKFMEKQGFGMFGQTLFYNRVPNSLKTDTDLFWIIPSGGRPVRRNISSEQIKAYNVLIYYRSMHAKKVDEVLSKVEKMFNCLSCINLEDFETISISANQYATSIDLDAENRNYGFVSVEIQVYSKC